MGKMTGSFFKSRLFFLLLIIVVPLLAVLPVLISALSEGSVDTLFRNKNKQLLLKDIPVPEGYKRVSVAKDSYAYWLRNLPLKSDSTIFTYTGEPYTGKEFNILAVLDKPLLFDDNSEQCIDFALRLHSDYCLETHNLSRLYLYNREGDKIHFSAIYPDYEKLSAEEIERAYRHFLHACFFAVNPKSLVSGGFFLPVKEFLASGDCIIQINENSGHTSVLLDECRNDKGEKLFLIGFGYYPAQEFHIEKAPPGYGVAGWFSLEGYLLYIETYYSDWGYPFYIRI